MRRPLLLVALPLLSAACGTGTSSSSTTPPPSPLAAVRAASSTPLPLLAPPTAAPPRTRMAVKVTLVKEPNDYAHRNYCGSGATQVLVSAWTPVPDIERVARLAHLDPRSGQTGANTVPAINQLIAPVTVSILGAAPYAGHHTDSLSDVVTAIATDLADPRVTSAFGHGAPVMVQTMTRTLPGWNNWQATHMITIYAADLSTGDPARDTVTYAETPSPIAAYTGPPSQVISVAALWAAMQAHTKMAPEDPVNLIDLAR